MEGRRGEGKTYGDVNSYLGDLKLKKTAKGFGRF